MMLSPAKIRSVVALTLVLLAPRVQADSWVLYGTRIFVSPEGRYYVIVDGRSFETEDAPPPAPSTIHLVERSSDSAPLDPAVIDTEDLPAGGPLGLIDRGDRVVHSTRVAQVPVSTYVMDDGRIVLIDCWGARGGGELVTVVGPSGGVSFSLAPDDVLPGFKDRFGGTASSIIWQFGHWLDESLDALVLVSLDHVVTQVDLSTGRVTRPPPGEVLFSPTGAETEVAKCVAWETASAVGLTSAEDQAVQAVLDESLPLSVRTRATLLAAPAAPDAARQVMLEATRSDDYRAKSWAWRNLGQLLGREALPLYREALRESVVDRAEDAAYLYQGVAGLGDDATDMVLDTLFDAHEAEQSEGLALRALILIEYDYATTGTYAFRRQDREAFESLRDDEDLDSLPVLLRMKSGTQWRPEPRYSSLALAALEQLRRQPHPEAAPAIRRFLGFLDADPHPFERWNERLVDAGWASLAACVGAEVR